MSIAVAVVGLQFKHSVFIERFLNLTTKYAKELCTSETNDCYLLDNNAFIIHSNDTSNVGRFFGELDGVLLQEMVNNDIYHKVHMYDYQAICLEPNNQPSLASLLLTPLQHFKGILLWSWSKVLALYVNLCYNSWFIEGSNDCDNDYDGDYCDPGICHSIYILLIFEQLDRGKIEM